MPTKLRSRDPAAWARHGSCSRVRGWHGTSRWRPAFPASHGAAPAAPLSRSRPASPAGRGAAARCSASRRQGAPLFRAAARPSRPPLPALPAARRSVAPAQARPSGGCGPPAGPGRGWGRGPGGSGPRGPRGGGAGAGARPNQRAAVSRGPFRAPLRPVRRRAAGGRPRGSAGGRERAGSGERRCARRDGQRGAP